MALGDSAKSRQLTYRELFRYHVEGDLIKDIRSATNKGMAIGSEEFKRQIEQLTGRRMIPAKMGKSKKQRIA